MSISSLPETPTVTVPTATSTRLYNDDLSPVTNRNWGVYNFFAMWMQDIHSITVYTFAASLFFMGLNGGQVFIALTVSVLIIWGLMNLSGIAGQRTGVPFPVLARSSFGIWGANIPALIRAGIAVIYYGILTYLGSTGLQIAALRVAHDAVEPLTHPTYLDSEDARASPNRTVQQAGHQSGGSHDHTLASEPRDARARRAEVG